MGEVNARIKKWGSVPSSLLSYAASLGKVAFCPASLFLSPESSSDFLARPKRRGWHCAVSRELTEFALGEALRQQDTPLGTSPGGWAGNWQLHHLGHCHQTLRLTGLLLSSSWGSTGQGLNLKLLCKLWTNVIVKERVCWARDRTEPLRISLQRFSLELWGPSAQVNLPASFLWCPLQIWITWVGEVAKQNWAFIGFRRNLKVGRFSPCS